MDSARTISLAVGAWMQYEFACGRSTLFSERYISAPIANALHHLYGKNVWAEYQHPVLAKEMKGRGRRPEVDFAVVDPYPDAKCVLESKWVGSSGLSAEDVLWDLIRLELAAHYTKADAYFVLAGRKKDLNKFFESKAFKGTADAAGKFRRLLKLDHRRNPRIRIDTPAKDRVSVLQKLITPYQELSFASRITTSLGYAYPEVCPNYQYQAYAWQVVAPPGTARFKPKDHSLYSSTTAQANDADASAATEAVV